MAGDAAAGPAGLLFFGFFIIICNGKIDERVYFKSWIELFAKKIKLPIMAFGGYGERKNDHGVLIVYLLQPEWWDRIIHLKKER